jgi:hypothetical protein
MRIEIKVWSGLGLATALAGAGLAGCSEEAPTAGGNEPAARDTAPGEGDEGGEVGEAGESGEGGVDFDRAASDRVVYLSALAVAEAHAIAAYDAFLAGRTEAAAEMFGHPVSEVLAEMDPVFDALDVTDFKPLFNEASQAVLRGRSDVEINERFGAIVAALEEAARKAPDTTMSEAEVSARVTAAMIDRAARMYREAKSSDRYAPYLDGYGFSKAAERTFEDHRPDILSSAPELHGRIAEALELLGRAYPGAERPTRLSENPGEIAAAGSRIELAL